MKNRKPTESPQRRKFLGTVFPLCALSLLGSSAGLTAQDKDQEKETSDESGIHKFDRKQAPQSNTQIFANRYRELMRLTDALEKEWGKEKLLEFLKKNTYEGSKNWGKTQAGQMGDDSFAAYTKQFRPPSFGDTLTHEVVEDTGKVFRLKVTECVWAKTFLDAGKGDIGYAHICYGDYGWTEGFNAKHRMKRDKTLMQGCDHCNHCYYVVED